KRDWSSDVCSSDLAARTSPRTRRARNSQFSICFSSRSCASTITVLRTVVARSDHPDGSAGIRELTAAENIPFGRPAAGPTAIGRWLVSDLLPALLLTVDLRFSSI